MVEHIDPAHIAHAERITHILETLDPGVPGEPVEWTPEHKAAFEGEVWADFVDSRKWNGETHEQTQARYWQWHQDFFGMAPGQTYEVMPRPSPTRIPVRHPNRNHWQT